MQFSIFLLIFHQFLFLHSHKMQIEELHLISANIPKKYHRESFKRYFGVYRYCQILLATKYCYYHFKI